MTRQHNCQTNHADSHRECRCPLEPIVQNAKAHWVQDSREIDLARVLRSALAKSSVLMTGFEMEPVYLVSVRAYHSQMLSNLGNSKAWPKRYPKANSISSTMVQQKRLMMVLPTVHCSATSTTMRKDATKTTQMVWPTGQSKANSISSTMVQQ